MVRKFILDSCSHWIKDYHVDGLRFDLMELMDIKTTKEIVRKTSRIDKNFLIYGEPWKGGDSPVKNGTYKGSQKKENFSVFNDTFRDAIRGDNSPSRGFINGDQHNAIKAWNIVEGLKGSIYTITYNPDESINYMDAHDNYTLWDKLQIVSPESSKEELIKINKLIAGIILTSQGISFVHAGEEMARTKVDEHGKLVENSFSSPDKVNKICWDRKIEYKDLVEYYKGLISLRKEYKAFRMNSNKDIQKNIHFLEKGNEFEADNLVAYIIDSKNIDDKCSKIAVIINANETEEKVKLNEEKWGVFVNDKKAGKEIIEELNSDIVSVPAKSIKVLIK